MMRAQQMIFGLQEKINHLEAEKQRLVRKIREHEPKQIRK
jgi:hypothetical protein